MDTQDNILLNGDKKICHGLGCFNKATNSIQEDGYDGTLMLCDDCIAKFPKQETYEKIRGTRILNTDNNTLGFPSQFPTRHNRRVQ